MTKPFETLYHPSSHLKNEKISPSDTRTVISMAWGILAIVCVVVSAIDISYNLAPSMKGTVPALLILAVIVWTIETIFKTKFYYSHPTVENESGTFIVTVLGLVLFVIITILSISFLAVSISGSQVMLPLFIGVRADHYFHVWYDGWRANYRRTLKSESITNEEVIRPSSLEVLNEDDS